MSFLKSVEKGGKRLLIKIISTIFPVPAQMDQMRLKSAAVRKILIVRIEKKLGNMVMSTFLPRAFKSLYHDAEIDLFVHKTMEQVWKRNPFVTRVLTFDHKKHLLNPLKLISLLLSIRKRGYDVVIDCSNPGGYSLSNGLLTRITGALYQVGFKRGESDLTLNVSVDPDMSLHYIDIIHQLLSPFAMGDAKFEPELFIPEETDKDDQQSETEITHNAVLLWVGARHDKQWNIEHFRTLANSLRSYEERPVYYVCGPGEKKLYENLRARESRDLLYIEDLDRLVRLIADCGLFVSGDAGPLHLAAALNKSTVGIFLQKNFSMYGYDNGRDQKVVDLAENPDNVQEVIRICKELMVTEAKSA